jgi:hypothetical protein
VRAERELCRQQTEMYIVDIVGVGRRIAKREGNNKDLEKENVYKKEKKRY